MRRGILSRFFFCAFHRLEIIAGDNAGDERQNQDAIERQQDGENAADHGNGNQIAEANGSNHGKGIPDRIPIGFNARFSQQEQKAGE